MAGNKKEVDLVIRAKDQAAGAVETVAKAIEQFVTAQKGLQAEGAKTDSTLAKIGSSFSELSKALGGASAFGAVERQVELAQQAITRLNKATAEAAGEAIGYQREALQAARASAELRAESERVAIAVEKQSKAVAASAAAQEKLKGITTSATADRAKLVAADEKLTNQIEQQRLKLFLASAALRDMGEELSATTGPTEKLTTQMSSVSREVRKAEQSLDELRTTQAVVRSSIEATGRAVEQANTKYGASAGAINAEKAALASLKATQADLATTITTTSNAQSKLEASARAAASGLERQEAALEAAEEAYLDTEVEARRMTTTLSKLEQTARGPLLKAFGQQSAAVAKLKAEFTGYRNEATRLGAAIAKATNPSAALIASFTKAQEAAARTKAAYREQSAELGTMRQILRESGGDLSTFADRQQRFVEVSKRAAGGLREFGAANNAALAAADRNIASLGQLAAGEDRVASSARRAAKETGGFAGALRSFYGESRTALSFTQRLRSEVLSLVAAYAGFYAVIGGIKQVVAAYQTLEAAQSRLNVVFDGDQGKTAKELDFLRRTANRLGVEFGDLAGEYGKFAVATKNTNLEGQKTRKIFVALAEAARVNKLSADNTKGAFVALTQIVSKGRVSMEELRQQLGDRIPGAIQIMAEAAGVGVDELFKLVETGQLSSDVLDKFADVLTKRFGSQLPAALLTTTTALGQLKNNLYLAFLQIAKGGFIERFTALIRDMNATLQSSGFESFLNRLSVGLGNAADALAFLARNFGLVVTAATAFLGLKLAPFAIAFANQIRQLPALAFRAGSGIASIGASASASAVGMNAGAVAARGFSVAIKGLLSSTGIGLAVVAIGAVIGSWVSSTDAATDAMSRHRDMVDRVKDAYDTVGGSVDAMQSKLDGLTTTDAQKSLEDLQAVFADTVDEFNAIVDRQGAGLLTTFFGTNLGADASKEYRDEVSNLMKEVNAGKIPLAELRKELDKIADGYRNTTAANKRMYEALDAAAKPIEEQAAAIAEAQNILKIKVGTDEEAAAEIKTLSGAVEENTDKIVDNTKYVAEWGKALQEIRGLIPDLKAEVEDFNERAKIKDALDAALQLARTYGQVQQAIELAKQATDALDTKKLTESIFGNSAGGPIGDALALIKQFEGRIEKPKWDVNAYRAGYGSDTRTNRDGSVQKITADMIISLEDAERDLARRLTEFQNVVKGQIGESRFNNFDSKQQAVLTSIAYNYGSLPERILGAVRSGSTKEIANAIRSLKGDNNSVNRGRREKEASIFEGGGAIGDKGTVAAEEERIKNKEKELELTKKQTEATAETIKQGDFNLAQQALINAGKEKQAAIEAAIAAAKKENPAITEAELAKIREQTGALYEQQHIGEERKKQLEEAEKAEKRVNDLLSARSSLQEQLKLAMEQGAGANVTQPLTEGIAQINTQLQTAIDQALELYRALGLSEPAIQAAVAKLETLKMASTAASGKIVIDWQAVEKQFASNLVRAFDTFSQQVAEGVPIAEAAKNAFLQFAADFLKSIAQMILQQVAFNIARGIFGAFGVPSAGVGVMHTGGMVGGRTAQRRVDPAMFANAMRYHSGGIAGLAPNEVPAILQRGEEILTKTDARHSANGGGGAGGKATQNTKIVNAIDSASFLSAALATAEGERTILNFMSANADAINSTRN